MFYRHCFSTLLYNVPLGRSCKQEGTEIERDTTNYDVRWWWLLHENIKSRKINAKALSVDGKKVGLAVNAVETKYVFLCCEQNAVQIHGINTNNKRTENMEKFVSEHYNKKKKIKISCTKKSMSD